LAGAFAARIAVVDVKAVRAKTELSQGKFSRTYHIPASTLQDWEQGRHRPGTGSVSLLKMIEADPKGVEKILSKVNA